MQKEKTIEKMLHKVSTDYKKKLKSKMFEKYKSYIHLTKKKKLKLHSIVNNTTNKFQKKLMTKPFDIYKRYKKLQEKRHIASKKIYKYITDNYETIKYNMDNDNKAVYIGIIDENILNIKKNTMLIIKNIKNLEQIIVIFKKAKFPKSIIILEKFQTYLFSFKKIFSSLIYFNKKYLEYKDLIKKSNDYDRIVVDKLFKDYSMFRFTNLNYYIKDYDKYMHDLKVERIRNFKKYQQLKQKTNSVKSKKVSKNVSKRTFKKKRSRKNKGNEKKKGGNKKNMNIWIY